jgi:NAD-dependent SIR2 family protein deacetylase
MNWDEMFAYRAELESKPGAVKAIAKISAMHGRFGKTECARCGAVADAEIHYVGTVDSHEFVKPDPSV